jgi:hypothetical protein
MMSVKRCCLSLLLPGTASGTPEIPPHGKKRHENSCQKFKSSYHSTYMSTMSIKGEAIIYLMILSLTTLAGLEPTPPKGIDF